MIVDQKPEIVIIKFDNEKCGQKQIKKNHPSYQEISFNEYNNKKIESKTKEIIEIKHNLWDRYEAALLVEAFWKIENKPKDKENILTELSNNLRKRAVNNGKEIDETFRNINGMKMQVNKVEAYFYPERPHLNKGGSVLLSACEVYKNNRDEFNKILLAAYQQINKDETVKEQASVKQYSIALSEVDFYTYIKETYKLKHKNDGKSRQAPQYAQKCTELIRKINKILAAEKYPINDIYKITNVQDVSEVANFISNKNINQDETEKKQLIYGLKRYRAFYMAFGNIQSNSRTLPIEKIFYLKQKHNHADAKMVLDDNKFRVLSGSRYNMTVGSSFSESEIKQREKLEILGIMKNGIFTSDFSFRSSSSAAKQITGNSVNGNLTWKLSDGTTLDDYLSRNNKSQRTTTVIVNESIVDVEARANRYPNYVKVLREFFAEGFSYSNPMRKSRFIKIYENINQTTFNDSDIEYERKLKTVGFESDGRIYLIDVVSQEIKEELKNFIEMNLEWNSVIYYSALYENFKEKLSADFSENMLKEYIKYVFVNDYKFENNFITKKGKAVDLKQQLIDVFMNVGVPMSSDDIYSRFPLISHGAINSLIKDKDFVVNSRGKSYFYKDIFIIDDDQIADIRKFLNSKIKNSGQVTGTELYLYIKNDLPEILENNPKITDLGIKNIIKLLLSNDFNFAGDVISGFGKRVDIKQLYQDFCRERKTFTFDELDDFRRKINQSYIDYSAVFDISLRVNKNIYIRRDLINFDVEKIDNAISNYCIGNYISFLDVISYREFPSSNYPWNTYLLEGFVYSESNKFKLLNKAFNREKPIGAIVKKTSRYNTFDDVVIDILDDNNITDKEYAFAYLLENDYIFTKKFKNIDLFIRKK